MVPSPDVAGPGYVRVMRNTLLVLHILAAASWFGTNMVQVAVLPGINRQGAAAAASWHRTALGFVYRIYTPAAVVSVATGILLLTAVDTPYEFSHAFVSIGFLMIIVGSVMGVGFFAKQGRAAAEAYDAGDTDGAMAIEKKIAAGGALDTVLMIVTVAAMVAKWGVWAT